MILRQSTIVFALACAVGLGGQFALSASDAQTMRATSPGSTLEAGRNYELLGHLRLLGGNHAVTYADAIRVFGPASSCRPGRAYEMRVTWKSLGVWMRLATLGAMPRGKNGCTAPKFIYIDSAYITSRRWQTSLGLRVGDTEQHLHDFYPNAIYQRQQVGSWPSHSYWLVHVRERCVIGVCRSKYQEVPRLTAQIRNGRVRLFFFPVGAQGE